MAKDKSKSGVPNRHLHARISYLQQAATYLTARQRDEETIKNTWQPTSKLADGSRADVHTADPNGSPHQPNPPDDPTFTEQSQVFNTAPSGGLPLHLAGHLKQIAGKSLIRLHTNVKHVICRRCSAVLIEGETGMKRIENLSKGGKKSWADVLVVECRACGAGKRFPVGATRPKAKGARVAVAPPDAMLSEPGHATEV